MVHLILEAVLQISDQADGAYDKPTSNTRNIQLESVECSGWESLVDWANISDTGAVWGDSDAAEAWSDDGEAAD